MSVTVICLLLTKCLAREVAICQADLLCRAGGRCWPSGRQVKTISYPLRIAGLTHTIIQQYYCQTSGRTSKHCKCSYIIVINNRTTCARIWSKFHDLLKYNKAGFVIIFFKHIFPCVNILYTILFHRNIIHSQNFIVKFQYVNIRTHIEPLSNPRIFEIMILYSKYWKRNLSLNSSK
jgi:hypothetical protein